MRLATHHRKFCASPRAHGEQMSNVEKVDPPGTRFTMYPSSSAVFTAISFAPRPRATYPASCCATRRLQSESHPCIIIAGSGMFEGGRIPHHFTKGLAGEKNSAVIVGFMAQHTLGRRLLEGRARVKVFGVERDVHAHIHYLGGLSAHADADDLVAFAELL